MKRDNFDEYKKSVKKEINDRLNKVEKREQKIKEQRIAMDQDVKKVIEKIQRDMELTNDAAEEITKRTAEKQALCKKLRHSCIGEK